MTKTATKEIQRRFLAVDEPIVKDDLLTISVSSEYPVERGFGKEVLSHKAGAIDLKRFNDAAPVLWSHDPKIQVGVIKRAYLEGKKLKTDIQFGNSEKAKEVQADVASGIIRNVSIGYVIHEVREEDDYMLATKWEPLEASFVSVASDPTIGVQRSHPQINSSKKMTETEMIEKGIIPDPSTIPTIAQRKNEFETESREFSIIEASKGIASGRGLTGRELEVNQELERINGKRTQGFFVPDNGWNKRAYVAGTASAGGNLIATDLLDGNFIEALRNRTVVGELGATYLPGLVGNVAIPKRATDNTAYWFAGDNSDSITESTGTISQVTMSPKNVAALTKFSYLMSMQSTPEIEQIIRNGFVAIIANAIDEAALNGSGSSNQPTGVLNQTGIGSVAGATNGAAATLDNLIDLKKEVSVDNADMAGCSFVTNSKVEAALSKLKDGNSAYHLSPFGGEIGKQQIASRRLEITNAIPSNLTKGSGSNLSAILYGNFKDLYIGTFNSLEILVDPYTDFAKGTTAVRAIQSLDIAVAHAQSFAAMKDAIAA